MPTRLGPPYLRHAAGFGVYLNIRQCPTGISSRSRIPLDFNCSVVNIVGNSRSKRTFVEVADETDPKHRLILAAQEVFATKGREAASVREIGTFAGANIAAINYHFGS